MDTKEKFLELKRELQKNSNPEQFQMLSDIYVIFLDYGAKKYTDGLHKGTKITKEAYKI